MVRVKLSSTGWTNGRPFGDVWLGLWLWHFLKLDEIVDQHMPMGHHTVRPADVVAIEVINRLCAPCSEFAVAEHWYASTGLEDLLGVAGGEITKDRLYRTLDLLLKAKEGIEEALQERTRKPFRPGLRRGALRLNEQLFRGPGEGEQVGPRAITPTIAGTVSRSCWPWW